jgi:ABC-type transporter MlaC component
MLGLNVLLLGALVLLPSAAFAGGAEQFVLDFNQHLSSELGPTGLSDDDRRARFASLLDNDVDLDTSSALMLGDRWTKASAQDRAAFHDALRDYLIRNFATRIRGIGERRLTITGLAWDGRTATVSSELSAGQTGPLALEWHVSLDADTAWRLTNVAVAGLSMAAVMRSQFEAVPDQDGAGLIPLISLLRNQQRS